MNTYLSVNRASQVESMYDAMLLALHHRMPLPNFPLGCFLLSRFCQTWDGYMWNKLPGQKSFPIPKIYARLDFVLSLMQPIFVLRKFAGQSSKCHLSSSPLGQARTSWAKPSWKWFMTCLFSKGVSILQRAFTCLMYDDVPLVTTAH